jgi:hypothetical protein
MNDFSRILVNLLVSYSLANKESFIDHVEAIVTSRNWDEKQVRSFMDMAFSQLQNWNQKESIKDGIPAMQPSDTGMKELAEAIKELTAVLKAKAEPTA